MNILFILNDPPYGTEKNYNALRLAKSVASEGNTTVRVFLIGDAAATAKRNQSVPKGYYHLELMISSVLKQGGAVGVCGTCLDARGISEMELIEGTSKSTLSELTQWTLDADKVLTF